MKKIIIGIDGYDGTGKSTLVDALLSYARLQQVSATCVGRDASSGDVAIRTMTDVIKVSDARTAYILDDRASFHLRLARAAQRFKISKCRPESLVMFDRFIINDMAALPVELHSEYSRSFWEIIDPSREILLVEIKGEFDLLWSRIVSRDILSPKERNGEDFNRALYLRQKEAHTDLSFSLGKLSLSATDSTSEQVQKIWSGLPF